MIIQQEEEIYKHKISGVSTPPTPALGEDHLRNVAERVSQAGPQHRTDGEGFSALDIEDLEEDEGEAVEADTPRLVTRGPHPYLDDTPLPHQPQKTKLDTLTFTAEEPFTILQELLVLSGGSDISFIPRKAGTNGYLRGFDIVLYAQTLGTLSYGSAYNEFQNIRPCIEIGGNGKTDKFNWVIFHHYASLLKSPKVTRADIALDLFKGEITIESATLAHINHEFKAPKANKDPKITPIGTIQPDGTNPGRTLYIGSMKSSKFLRIYEKSFEIYKRELEDEKNDKLGIRKKIESGQETVIDGYNNDEPFDLRKWVRVELQLRDGNCVLPLDILISTDKYFSGSYPYCEELLNMTDGKKPPRLMQPDEMDFDVRRRNHKAISGSFIEDCIYLGMTSDEIVQCLRSGKGPSQKLIRSGVLKEEFKRS